MKTRREQIIEIFDKHCTLVNKDYHEYIILSKSKFIDAILALFEQKESKSAEEILQKYIQTEDDEQRPFPYVRPSLALKAMEEYRQQPVIDLREELIKFKDWAVNESRNNALDIDEYLKTKQP